MVVTVLTLQIVVVTVLTLTVMHGVTVLTLTVMHGVTVRTLTVMHRVTVLTLKPMERRGKCHLSIPPPITVPEKVILFFIPFVQQIFCHFCLV
jgi:hypothetical protein